MHKQMKTKGLAQKTKEKRGEAATMLSSSAYIRSTGTRPNAATHRKTQTFQCFCLMLPRNSDSNINLIKPAAAVS